MLNQKCLPSRINIVSFVVLRLCSYHFIVDSSSSVVVVVASLKRWIVHSIKLARISFFGRLILAPEGFDSHVFIHFPLGNIVFNVT